MADDLMLSVVPASLQQLIIPLNHRSAPATLTPTTRAEIFESLALTNSIREENGNFDSYC